ncbi:MAG: hypothetical protein KDK36_14160, partial [Leptospiraceae bacterium]|nr:hypothetical protein [Leptospiraceae bacterium]
MKNKNSKVWLIGSGPMAIAYANVLKSLKADFQVIGRGENSAKSFEEKTAIKVKTGGLENWLKTKPEIPGSAIIAVSVEQLSKTTIQLLNYGI